MQSSSVDFIAVKLCNPFGCLFFFGGFLVASLGSGKFYKTVFPRWTNGHLFNYCTWKVSIGTAYKPHLCAPRCPLLLCYYCELNAVLNFVDAPQSNIRVHIYPFEAGQLADRTSRQTDPCINQLPRSMYLQLPL